MQADISRDEIEEILARYAIGKKPLARLLGWGDVTIIRYLSGDQPTLEYARRLKEIHDQPERYLKLLSERKDCLTGVALRKSTEAVYQQIYHTKLRAAAGLLMELWGRSLSNQEMGCVLFYLQGFAMMILGRPFYEEEFILRKEEEGVDGPLAAPEIQMFRELDQIHAPEAILRRYFSKAELGYLYQLQEALSWYGARTIEMIWREDRQAVKKSRDKQNRRMITKESMERYLEEVTGERYSMERYFDRRYRRIRGWERNHV